jgi:hypothetical protein
MCVSTGSCNPMLHDAQCRASWTLDRLDRVLSRVKSSKGRQIFANLSGDSSDRGKLVRADLVGMARICRKGEVFCFPLEKTEQMAARQGTADLPVTTVQDAFALLRKRNPGYEVRSSRSVSARWRSWGAVSLLAHPMGRAPPPNSRGVSRPRFSILSSAGPTLPPAEDRHAPGSAQTAR